MEVVVENITGHLEEKNILFVFPSEVVASFWRKKSLSFGIRRAVRADRFLSWDRFKESLFFLTRERRPVNNIHRLLFAASLALENRDADKPILTSIIHPQFRTFSFRYTDSIVSALPGLKTIIRAVKGRSTVLEPDLEEDLHLLWNRYARFLEEYKLFEPEYEEFTLADLKSKALLFYPEIIQDYSRFHSQLQNNPVLTSLHLGRTAVSEGQPGYKYVLFDNPLQEVKYVLSSIEKLLNSEVSVDEIGITMADLESLPLLSDEAVLRGIPLNIRQGEVLSGYPAGRLFLQLKETAASDYSFSSLKNLLMNRRYPWKDPSIGAALIAFGIRQYCMKGKQEWKKRIAVYGSPLISDYFTNLFKAIEGIVGASSFSDIKKGLFRFIHTFFNDDGWEPDDEKVFQTCINILNDMAETGASLPGVIIQDPYSLYLKVLSSRVYVTRERDGGVPVFPYRVSAGIGVTFHFLLGITEKSVKVLQPGFPYLREDQKQALKLKETEFTEVFLKAYTQSGEKVLFTGSREGVNDSHRIPSFFLRQDGSVSSPSQQDAVLGEDLYGLETELWEGSCTTNPGGLYPLQKEGFFNAFKTGLTKKGDDYSRQDVENQSLRKPLEELQREKQTGHIQISATRLEGYVRCPFRFLVSVVLGILVEEFDLTTGDPKEEGVLFHQIVTDFFVSIRTRDGIFNPARLTDYQQILEDCIEMNFRRWKGRGGLFIPPLVAYQRRKITELLTAFLSEEMKTFPGFEIVNCEYELTLPMDAQSARLSGRIDRISRNEEGYLLLDYKKKNRVKRKDLLGEQPTSYQMPFYTILAEGAGMEIAHVSYYDFESKRYDHVLRPGTIKSWTDQEGMANLTSRTLNKVQEMIDAVKQGSYRCTRDSERCSPCEYRIVCRERYVLG